MYYDRVVDPKMFMALKSLAEVRTKTTIDPAKQITKFLNESELHTESVTEYIRSGIIIRIYSDAS